MSKLSDRLKHLHPCSEASAWLDQQATPQQAWQDCPRGDWMLWLLGHLITSLSWTDERKPLLLCALDCAETVKHLWPAEQAPKIASDIEVLRQWAAGTTSVEEAVTARESLWRMRGEGAAYAAAAFAADAAFAAFAAYAAAYAAAFAAAFAAADADADAAAYAAAAAAAYDAAYDAAFAAADAYAVDAAAYTAYIAAKGEIQRKCADIARQHFPNPPQIKSPE